MIIDRCEEPNWLSNAYLVADAAGGHGVLIDGNGVVEPLLERIAREDIAITHILLTHHHVDHVVGIAELKSRFGVPVVAHADTASELDAGLVDRIVGDGETIVSGSLRFQALDTPGHCAGHIAYLVDGDCFTADVLFKGTVGGNGSPGGNFSRLQRSIMERLMSLPAETRVHPGHREPTTIGAEWDENPFIRVWRGLDPEGAERCVVRERPASLLLWAPDYDGGHKALVRYDDGEVAVVGGSQVRR
jgi:glyoxylase-like metal-dependent hydrolase (beta-lactamase superfamily II)